jgi:hypothetical protein
MDSPESQAGPQAPHHRSQDLSILLVWPTLCLSFVLRVEFENRSIRQNRPMVCQHGAQSRQYARLPVNQSSITVKADGSKTREIHRKNKGVLAEKRSSEP